MWQKIVIPILIGAVTGIVWLMTRNEPQKYEEEPSNRRKRSRAPPPPANICCICREEYYPPLEIAPCHHIFHKSCIRDWFRNQMSCPLCRKDVPDHLIHVYKTRLGLPA